MLPVHRLIGHKEYAAGRKSDPVYDMNWRRGRVANFTGGAPAPAATREWDEMASKAEIKDAVREVLGEERPRQGFKADGSPQTGQTSFLAMLDWFDNAIQAIPGMVLGLKFKRQGDLAAAQWGPDSETTLGSVAAWSDQNLMRLGAVVGQDGQAAFLQAVKPLLLAAATEAATAARTADSEQQAEAIAEEVLERMGARLAGGQTDTSA